MKPYDWKGYFAFHWVTLVRIAQGKSQKRGEV